MMSQTPLPQVTSFVIRFVHEESSQRGEQENWRGAIRHVQTEQETTFRHWGKALNFMGKFLPEKLLEETK